MPVVLDTSILIDVLRGKGSAVDYLDGLEEVPVCSEVTRVEILRGMLGGERHATERLFRDLRWVPVDEDVARWAGAAGRRWRRSHPGISTADLIVAATAQQFDAELATTNVRHYPMFKGLRPPYRE